MKRSIATLLALAATPLMALPLNNPMQPLLINEGVFCCDDNDCCWMPVVRLGFYGDYIYNTKMQFKRTGQPDVHNVSLTTNAGQVVLNWSCFDIFGTVGATTTVYEFTGDTLVSVSGDSATGRIIVQLPPQTGVSWSVGGCWTPIVYQCMGWGFEGQYFRDKATDISTVSGTTVAYNDGITCTYSSWQVGTGVNLMIAISDAWSVNPYGGFFWTDSNVDFNPTAPGGGITSLTEIEKKQQFGWAFGTTIAAGQKTTLTAEGRWGGEKALFINGQMQF